MTRLRYSDVMKRGAPSTTARRDALLDWLRERDEHQGLTARQIVDVSGIYNLLRRRDGSLTRSRRQQRASNDLRVLQRCELARTDQHRCGRWWPL